MVACGAALQRKPINQDAIQTGALGQGLDDRDHVLPVAVARRALPGLDLVEHTAVGGDASEDASGGGSRLLEVVHHRYLSTNAARVAGRWRTSASTSSSTVTAWKVDGSSNTVM